MTGDYFDALPIHPQPEPLESFTGYLTRLAEANKIQAVYQLKPLFFPQHAHGVIREMADYPISSLGELPVLAACSESRLLGTTFYYLMRRFNRSTRPQATGQFLAGVVARRFRYCPLCLAAETPYYSLAWRFQTLSGCPQHGCHLLNQCPHCKHDIPFLTTALKIGVCPDCGGGLSAGSAESLVEAERRQAQRHYRDLAFLLAIPADNAAAVAPGPRLTHWRRLKGMTVEEVAQQSGKTARLIQSLEHYRLARNVKLQHYLDYVDCLGLSFAELFATELSPKAERRTSFPLPEEGQSYEEQLVQRVEQGVATLKAEGTLLTQRAVSNHVGMSITGLRHYPQVKALLTRLNQERCQQLRELRERREVKLVDEVEQAVTVLQGRGAVVTQEAIGKLVGMTPTGLSDYPTVRVLLQELTRQKQGLPTSKALNLGEQNTACPPSPSDVELAAKVEQAIVDLQMANRPVSQLAICRSTGLPRRIFYTRPDLSKQVAKARRLSLKRQKEQRQQELLEQLENAMTHFRAMNIPFSMEDVYEQMGTAETKLRYYPEVQDRLRQVVRERRERDRSQRIAQREQALMDKVQLTIGQLQEQGRPVTQKAICQEVGVAHPTLRRYPRVQEMLNWIMEEGVARMN